VVKVKFANYSGVFRFHRVLLLKHELFYYFKFQQLNIILFCSFQFKVSFH